MRNYDSVQDPGQTAPGASMQDEAAQAFIESDSILFDEALTHGFSFQRIIAAQSMGAQIMNQPDEKYAMMLAGQFYPGVLHDASCIVWLCMQSKEGVALAKMNPSAACVRVGDWMEAEGIEEGSAGFQKLLSTFGAIIGAYIKTKMKVEGAGGDQGPESGNGSRRQ